MGLAGACGNFFPDSLRSSEGFIKRISADPIHKSVSSVVKDVI